MNRLFLGPPRFWLIWIVVTGVLHFMGDRYLHVSAYGQFLAVLGTLGLGAVLWVVFGTRKGERITREPIEDGS